LGNLTFDSDSHAYKFNGVSVPSVSRILVDGGFVNLQWFTEAGRERGTSAHKAIEQHCIGAHCAKDETAEPYLLAFMHFQSDCVWEPIAIEHRMGCPLYAGTADQIGALNGALSVLDVKTGAISAATGLQLTAYERLYGSKTPMKRIALQVTSEGKYKLTEYKDRTDRYVWDSAVAIWHWKKNNGIK